MIRVARALARWLGVVLIGVTLAMFAPGAAQAATHPGSVLGVGGDCKDEPVPAVPGRNNVWTTSRPDPLPPEGANPFGERPNASIYEVYGSAGFRYTTYDLGCVPSPGDAAAEMYTGIANAVGAIATGLVDIGATLGQFAMDPGSWVHAFDGLLTTGMTRIRDEIARPLGIVVIALLGGFILLASRRLAFAKAITMALTAVLVVAAATVLTAYPTRIADWTDQVKVDSVGAINADLNGVDEHAATNPGMQVAGNLADSVLFQQWLVGEFGSADSTVAKKYGAALFDAQALTWREADTLEKDPDAGQKIIERKQAAFKDIAAKVADEDPNAYEHLKGENWLNRIGAQVYADFATGSSMPFYITAMVLLIASYLVIRLLLMCAPFIAAIGLAHFPVVKSTALTFAAAVLNVIGFGFGAALQVFALSLLLDPGSHIPGLLGAILMLALSVILWMALKPFRSLTRLVRDPNPGKAVGDGMRSMTSTGKRLGMTALGSFVGGAAAGAALHAAEGGEDDDGHFEPPMTRDPQPYRWSRPESEVRVDDVEPLALPAGTAPGGAGAIPLPPATAAHAPAAAAALPAGLTPPPPAPKDPQVQGAPERPALGAAPMAYDADTGRPLDYEIHVPGATPAAEAVPMPDAAMDPGEDGAYVIYVPADDEGTFVPADQYATTAPEDTDA